MHELVHNPIKQSHLLHVAPNILKGGRALLCSPLVQAVLWIFTGSVGYRWVVLECCAEMVRADIADQRWESACREHRGVDSPRGHGKQRCICWCNGEWRGQTIQENNPRSRLLNRSPGSLLAALDLGKVWDFQGDSPSGTPVSAVGKETLWGVVTFLNEPSCMHFHLSEHKKAI